MKQLTMMKAAVNEVSDFVDHLKWKKVRFGKELRTQLKMASSSVTIHTHLLHPHHEVVRFEDFPLLEA